MFGIFFKRFKILIGIIGFKNVC